MSDEMTTPQPTPPAGQAWHKPEGLSAQDWQDGWRPLLISELNGEPHEDIEWTTVGLEWSNLEHADYPVAIDDMGYFRTKRPLPTTEPAAEKPCDHTWGSKDESGFRECLHCQERSATAENEYRADCLANRQPTPKPRLSDLTPEAKRVLIAEACDRCPHTEKEYWSIEDGNDFDSGFTCKKCGEDPHRGSARMPDYLTSLDACAEIEKTLSEDEHKEFRRALWRDITQGVRYQPDGYEDATNQQRRAFVSATAEQRANAFILAKGLATL